MAFAAAFVSVCLWGVLATLGLSLSHVPPFLLTGLALLIGSIPSIFYIRSWFVSFKLLVLGVYGLFGFHFLLFLALRYAPPVEANLVNYSWPVLIVLMTPFFFPTLKLNLLHLIAAIMGFTGVCLAIGGKATFSNGNIGFIFAGMSALVWSTYSLASRRIENFPSCAIGGFCIVSGLMALLCHFILEPAVHLQSTDFFFIVFLGLGPMGAAFYTWNFAIKRGDPRIIGLLACFTPLLSTAILLLYSGRGLSLNIIIAAIFITGAAVVCLWANRRKQ